ncbi:amidohydrolase family protein [Arthrobacter sp. 2RAF6]|uniref:amidohydrolase family protein n=1 Tax=Arthrobacter sp. 2RAF6 TaxID=3233002 RepID=UPI003F92ABCD
MSDTYTLVSNEESIGSMSVERALTDQGTFFDVHWLVDDNGRGAKLHEQIWQDQTGMQTRWHIRGTSLMGGTVDESFAISGERVSWTSQADEGQTTRTGPGVYVPADETAWSWILLTQAALAAGGTIALFPSGQGTANVVRHVDDVDVRVVELSGATLHPKYVLLGADDAVAGAMDELMLVLSPRLIEHAPELRRLREQLATERLRRVSAGARLSDRNTLLMRNVRVLDVEAGKLGSNSDLMIENGIIRSITPAGTVDVADIDVIDCHGLSVLPGLHDMHAHIAGADALLNVAAGVTTVRDMGNDPARLEELVSAIESGDLVGPSVVPAGFIEGRSPYSARFGKIVSSVEEAVDAVRWYAERGYTMVKLYNSIRAEWVPATAAEAHRLGMRVLGHIPAFSNADQAVLDGFDEVTHLNQLALGWLLAEGEDSRTPLRLTALARAADLSLDDPRVLASIELLRSNNIGVDTTAFIIERLMLSRARTTLEADQPFLEHMPPAYQRQRRRTYVPFTEPADLEQYDAAFTRLLEILGLLYRSGIDLWPGTDDGTGFPIHRELELYVLAGMTPAEAIYRATAACAAHLGRGATHGHVRVGYAADLIVVEGDPTVDVSVVRRVALSLLGGRAVSPSSIYKAMGIKPFIDTPELVTVRALTLLQP